MTLYASLSIAVLALTLCPVGHGQAPALPNAPQVPTVPGTGQTPAGPPLPPALTIEHAIELARKNNPTLNANQMLISQSKAQEITANLRPNPLLSWDSQYLPLFQPSLFTDGNYWGTQAQYDIGVGYLFERGHKRQSRLQAAKDVTRVTESQVADAERTTVASAAQQFVAALLAQSNLEFAREALTSFQHTVNLTEERYRAGAISKADLLKIQLQTLQFQTDVNNALLAKKQALASLRQLVGFDSVPVDYELAGGLVYEPLTASIDDLQARALSARPDLQGAERGITSAQSQVALAKANAKQDLNVSFNYTRYNDYNLGALYFNIPLPIFNKNQGEIARTRYALSQSQFQKTAAEQAVLTDVKTAYEALRRNEDSFLLYNQGYLKQAQESLEITQFSYQHGAASLLDFLDAERSYWATELSYRQALANYMSSLEQLRLAVGTRNLP